MNLRVMIPLLALAGAGAAEAQRVLTEQEAAGGQHAIADQGTEIKAAAKPHFDAAANAAGDEFLGAMALCNSARPAALRLKLPPTIALRGAGPTSAELMRAGKTLSQIRAGDGVTRLAPAPVKIFDNLYYLGIEDASAWAVTTSAGIILIDALNNKDEWIKRIEPGMRAAGLDPAKIKYIVVTHGHGDHFGGAAHLAAKYGARILMSDADWKLAPSMVDKPWFDPPPQRDMTARDGQRLSLGGTTITLYVTPGHTVGTLSMLIPVTDGGRRHVAALWGGTGFNFPHTPDRFTTYVQSAARFRKLAGTAGADIALSPHAENDGAIHKITALSARKPGGPHPFVIGTDGVRRFLTVFGECAAAYRAQLS